MWGVVGDSATLGYNGSGGTITLDGANPSLASLSFDNSSAGYTIAAGSGGTLTFAAPSGVSIAVQAGTHAITAPISLANNTTINTASGTQLSISGGITEATPGTASRSRATATWIFPAATAIRDRRRFPVPPSCG